MSTTADMFKLLVDLLSTVENKIDKQLVRDLLRHQDKRRTAQKCVFLLVSFPSIFSHQLTKPIVMDNNASLL